MRQRLIDANKAESNLYGFTRYTGIDEAPYEHAEAVINKLPIVEAIPIEDIKDFLRCEKINTCDWLNCSECSQMKCISIRNLNDLIEWSKGRENEID